MNASAATPPAFDQLWVNARLATFDPAGWAPGVLSDHALAVRGDTIAAILPIASAELSGFRGVIHNCGGRLITPTLLAAHAVPPEFAGRTDDYVSLIVEEIIPAAAAEKLAEAVDVFCESIAFSPAQCDRIFAAARTHGVAVKGHVEQLSSLHGA